jgi:integrase
LVEFLAYTGVRLGEAKWIEWQHVDFERGTLVVVGEPNEGTKNREIRRVDLIPAARDLLSRLRKSGAKAGTKVLAVGEAQKSMVRAAKEVGMAKITHHDLRHFFATICIESGVDIPTVSRWMGHKDGGVLAMKVYGHLRAEHSQAAAARVSFAA